MKTECAVRIKSVSARKRDVEYPGARLHERFVCEDGESWTRAYFRLHRFEGLGDDDIFVFHRVSS